MVRKFRSREKLSKHRQCSCGNESKLIKRRNFPHGRKSDGKTYMFYKCPSCKKETPLNKSPESRR